jgi:AraC-like DNA-binding protein
VENQFLIRTNALYKIDKLIRLLNKDPAALLRKYDLTLDSLSSERDTMPISDFVSLLNHCATHYQCPDFGLRLGALQDFRILGPLGVLLENCHTPREALNAVRNFMVFHNQSEFWDYQAHGQIVVLQRQEYFHDIADTRQFKELSLSASFQLCHILLGSDFKCLRLQFSHTPISEKSAYKKLFNAEVLFNQEHDAIVMEGGFLDNPLKKSDQAVKKHTADYLQKIKSDYEFDIVQQVTTLIQQTLGVQEANIEHIANLLDVNKRTLQRQLKRQGIIFKELMSNIRIKNACWFLQSSTIDITTLSNILGYNDVSAFSRAFKKAKGTAPLKWRQENT